MVCRRLWLLWRVTSAGGVKVGDTFLPYFWAGRRVIVCLLITLVSVKSFSCTSQQRWRKAGHAIRFVRLALLLSLALFMCGYYCSGSFGSLLVRLPFFLQVASSIVTHPTMYSVPSRIELVPPGVKCVAVQEEVVVEVEVHHRVVIIENGSPCQTGFRTSRVAERRTGGRETTSPSQ